MATAEKKIRVDIRASQRVAYHQTVEMTKEQWEEMKATPGDELNEVVRDWLDLHDVLDSDDFEDVEMVVVGKNGKPVMPIDEYTG